MKKLFLIVLTIFWIGLLFLIVLPKGILSVKDILDFDSKSLISSIKYYVTLAYKKDYIFFFILLISSFLAGLKLTAGIIFEFRTKLNLILFLSILISGMISGNVLCTIENVFDNILPSVVTFLESKNLILTKDLISYSILILPITFIITLISSIKEIVFTDSKDYWDIFSSSFLVLIVSILSGLLLSLSFAPIMTITNHYYRSSLDYKYLLGLIISLSIIYLLGKLSMFIYDKYMEKLIYRKFLEIKSKIAFQSIRSSMKKINKILIKNRKTL